MFTNEELQQLTLREALEFDLKNGMGLDLSYEQLLKITQMNMALCTLNQVPLDKRVCDFSDKDWEKLLSIYSQFLQIVQMVVNT